MGKDISLIVKYLPTLRRRSTARLCGFCSGI